MLIRVQKIYLNLLRPSKPTTSKQVKVHKPLKEIIWLEANAYKSFVDEQKEQINQQVEEPEGLDVSRWWADHHENLQIWHWLLKIFSVYPRLVPFVKEHFLH